MKHKETYFKIIIIFERNHEQIKENKGFMCKINIDVNFQQKASDSYKKTSEIVTSLKNFTILSKINEGLQNISENHKISQKQTKDHKTHASIMILCTRTGPRQDHDRTTTGPRQLNPDHDRTTTGPRQDHDRYFKPDMCFCCWIRDVCRSGLMFLDAVLYNQ